MSSVVPDEPDVPVYTGMSQSAYVPVTDLNLLTHTLVQLHRFLIDAYSSGELALLVEQWDREVAVLLPNPRAVSLQEYAHALVEEVWRRRMWIGEEGLLVRIARNRGQRLREIRGLTAALERLCGHKPERGERGEWGERGELHVSVVAPSPLPPTAPDGVRKSASPPERVRREIVATPTIDLLMFIQMRLRSPSDAFWVESAELYRPLLAPLHSPNRLRLLFGLEHIVIEAWPHLVRDGQIMPQSSLEVRGAAHFHYCPRGRTTQPAYRLEFRAGRCSLSGLVNSTRYRLAFESCPSLET